MDGFNSGSAAQTSGVGSGNSESRQHPVNLLNDGNSGSSSQSSSNGQTGRQEQYQESGSKSFLTNQGAAGTQGQNHGQAGGQSSGHYHGSGQSEVSANRGDVDKQKQSFGASSNSFAANRGENRGQQQTQDFGQNAGLSDTAGQGYERVGSQMSSYHGGAASHGQYQSSGLQDMSWNRGNAGGYGHGQSSGSAFNGNAGQEQQLQSSNGQGSYGTQGGSGNYGASGRGNALSDAGGALDLASQGLKTASETQAGCSTCGKNSYAISNARSHSGSAVALSIGG